MYPDYGGSGCVNERVKRKKRRERKGLIEWASQ